MTAVVDDESGLGPDWLTAALGSAGHDLSVATAAVEQVGTGQMGTTYRLRLGYDRQGGQTGQPGQPAQAGPATLIAKVAGPDPELRKLVAPGYAAEVGFYRHLAASLDVRTPGCWYSAITNDHTRFTLLLDDAAPAEPGVQADGCSVDRARAAVANLVGLHAPRWGDPTLDDLDFLMRSTGGTAAMMGDILGSATESFVERYAKQLAADDVALLRDVAKVIGAWQLTRLEPSSVVHGDYRLDNLLFAPDGPEVVAVDWQSVAVGPPLRDVAYFLGTSLDTDVRRREEEALVAGYHAAVVDQGVAGYDADRCWTDYRLGHLQGPMIGIIGCIYASGERSERSDGMFLAMARRSCAAIRDLRSLDLV
jgi:hypothetical protein